MEQSLPKKKNKIVFSVLYMILGSIFLFNPDVMIIDVLPDFIGYLLILWGIRNLVDLNERFASARRLFFRCLMVGIFQIIGIWFLFSFLGDSDRPAMTLILTMLVVAGNSVFGILGFKAMFEGFYKVSAQASDDSYMVSVRKNKKMNEVDRIKIWTYVLFIVRGVFAIMPELSSLSTDEYSTVSPMFEHISAMRILSFIPPLIFGIIWLVKTIRFWRRAGKDQTMLPFIENKYLNEIAPNEGLAIHHAFKSSTVAFSAGAILFMPLFIDSTNFLPGFISALCFAIGIVYCRKFVTGRRLLIISLSLFGVLSVVSTIIQRWYFGMYAMEDVSLFMKTEELASSGIWAVRILTLLEGGCAIFFLIRLFFTYTGIILNYTGLVLSEHDDVAYTTRKKEENRKALIRKMIIPFSLGILTEILYVIFLFVFTKFKWFSIFPIVFGVVFGLTFFFMIGNILEAVERRYYIAE